jgi:hypothetical protein
MPVVGTAQERCQQLDRQERCQQLDRQERCQQLDRFGRSVTPNLALLQP